MAGAAVQARGGRPGVGQAKPPVATVIFARLMWTLRGLWEANPAVRFRGGLVAAFGAGLIAAFATYDPNDPSWNSASDAAPRNLLGGFGAAWADAGLQSLGLAAWIGALSMVVAAARRLLDRGVGAVLATLGAVGLVALVLRRRGATPLPSQLPAAAVTALMGSETEGGPK